MKAELHGYWIDLELYNTDLSDSTGSERMDTIGLTITSKSIFGGEEKIVEAHLYPEDLQNLLTIIPPVLKDALDSREKYESLKILPNNEFTEVVIEGVDEVYQIYKKNLLQELSLKFGSGEWFEIPRNNLGVSDVWGNSNIYEKFIPFLVWNSRENKIILVDETWKETTLYHDISWCLKYTHLRGITKPTV